MVKHFTMEETKKLSGLTTNHRSMQQESEDLCILLDLLWKSKQVSFSNTPLCSGAMTTDFGKSEKNLKSVLIYSTLKYIEELA